MPKYKVRVTEDCIGCQACVATCEENFAMDDNTNKAYPKKKIITDKELEKNNEAKEVCPVEAIKIEND